MHTMTCPVNGFTLHVVVNDMCKCTTTMATTSKISVSCVMICSALGVVNVEVSVRIFTAAVPTSVSFHASTHILLKLKQSSTTLVLIRIFWCVSTYPIVPSKVRSLQAMTLYEPLELLSMKRRTCGKVAYHP